MKKRLFYKIFLMATLIFYCSCSSDNAGNDNNHDVPYSPEKPIVVSSIGPTEGGLGTRIVVGGSNFGNDASKVRLLFNKKEAVILKIQNNAIYAMVPKQPGELSTITVQVQEGLDPAGMPVYKEAVLENVQFKYNIKATVTTVAGQWRDYYAYETKEADGMALEAHFGRPVHLAVDDEGTVLVVDDNGGKMIRMYSVPDNKVTTVLSNLNQPWQCSFNLDFSRFYVIERDASSRPLLFYSLSKESNWQTAEAFYDQRDENGEWMSEGSNAYGLAADDKYVYVLTNNGRRLLRVDQGTRKVEVIGQNLDLGAWPQMAFNPKNRLLYICNEDRGFLYRLNPYYTPEGYSKPWITQSEVEHIVGNGVGVAVEGNGKNATIGKLEACAADHEGNVYLCDWYNYCIWKVDEELNTTVLAGRLEWDYYYRDGAPREAAFYEPYGVASTPDGIVYVADTYNYCIRCIAIQ